MAYRVIVEYDYSSRANDERNLHKGEIILVYNYNDEWLKDLNGMFIPRNFVRVLHSPASTAQPSTTTEIYSKQIKNAISSENNNGVIIQANNLSIGIGYGVLLAGGFVTLLMLLFLFIKFRKNGLECIRRWINNLFGSDNDSIENDSVNNRHPNYFLRREQQQVDEPVYENDFDSFDERDENSRIRQVLTNQISYLNTSQNAPHNVQINNTSVVNVNNNESSLNLNKILVIDVDNKLNENQSQIKEKSLPFIKSFVSKSKMVRSESIYYVCNQCNEFETENQEEMVKHLENNHEDFLNNMINVNH